MRLHGTVIAAFVSCLFQAHARAGEILNLGYRRAAAGRLGLDQGREGRAVRSPARPTSSSSGPPGAAPAATSIPHLTELAHRYKDKGVRFVGVDVWERDTKLVKPFVDEMGDKMDYSVALDAVPEKGDPNDGAMARAWMRAAEENGIPTAFVVHDGKIAWIGHPMEMDEPLAKIIAGDWDPRAMARKRLVEKTKERKATLVREKVFPLYNARNYKATVAAIDEATGD